MVVVVFVLLASSSKVLCPRCLGTKGLAKESASSSFVAMLVVVRKSCSALWAGESVASSFSAATLVCWRVTVES